MGIEKAKPKINVIRSEEKRLELVVVESWKCFRGRYAMSLCLSCTPV